MNTLFSTLLVLLASGHVLSDESTTMEMMSSTDDEIGMWSVWGSCPATCGFGIFEERTRTCNSDPDCVTTELRGCVAELCPEQYDEAVSMEVGGTGLTQEIFSEVADDVKDEIARLVNEYCTGSVSNAMRCCATSNTLNDPAGKTFAQSTDIELLYEEFDDGNGVELLFTVDYDDTNAVCSDVASKRRKRATFSFDQAVLQEIFANQTIRDILDAAIETALNTAGYTITVTLAVPTVPVPPTTSTMATTTMAMTTEAGGVEAWVIAISVVIPLVVIAIIIIVVVVVVKKKAKVADADIE